MFSLEVLYDSLAQGIYGLNLRLFYLLILQKYPYLLTDWQSFQNNHQIRHIMLAYHCAFLVGANFAHFFDSLQIVKNQKII